MPPGPPQMPRRWFTTDDAGSLLVIPPSARASGRRVVQNILKTMEHKINETDWIEGSTWCLMIEKAKKLVVDFDYPDELANESLLDAIYADVPDVSLDFFTPYVESHRVHTIRGVWGNVTGVTTEANAAYDSRIHAATLHAGLLQPPAFMNNGPAAMNYAGLGQIAGHEMMHSLDVDAIWQNYKGDKIALGNTRSTDAHTAKVLCLRSSYAKADPESRARNIRDEVDSEGFADFAGIQLAYAAYLRLPLRQLEEGVPGVGLTAAQAFFVSHCLKGCTGAPPMRRNPSSRYWPSRSRCIVPLQNMPEFAEAFSCKPGDFMNPESKCTFW